MPDKLRIATVLLQTSQLCDKEHVGKHRLIFLAHAHRPPISLPSFHMGKKTLGVAGRVTETYAYLSSDSCQAVNCEALGRMRIAGLLTTTYILWECRDEL